MELVKKSLGTWIKAAIVLTIGILCIVFGAAINQQDPEAAENAYKAISLVGGIALIVVGALCLGLAIFNFIKNKKELVSTALPGALVLALGISFVVSETILGDIFGALIYVVPFLLLALGAVLLADGVIKLITTIKEKGSLVSPIVEIVLAAAVITVGALCVNGAVIKGEVQFIIFGIILVLSALFMVLTTFVKMPGKAAE